MADNKKKISDFLSRKYSEEGKAMFEAWYKSFDDTQSESENIPGEQLEQELTRIKNGNSRALEPTARRNMAVYWRMAATLLILLTIGITLYSQWEVWMSRKNAITYAEQTTAKGERLEYTLSDGTRIWLNAESKLRYPEKFAKDSREVHLSGEAFFEVTRNPEKPFIIHTDKLTTTVLGTSFNVQAYADGSVTEVAVVTGKVSVALNNDIKTALILTPSQKAVLNKGTAEFTRLNIKNASGYAAWKDGRLIADNRSVNSILQALNRTYNATVKVENEALGECRITAEFDAMPLERLLDLLCPVLNATYSKQGDVYVIHGKGCAK